LSVLSEAISPSERFKCAHRYNAQRGGEEEKMGEEEGYRAVTLRCEPMRLQRPMIERNLEAVTKFAETGRYEFQKMLYHKFKEQDFDISSRTVDLMTQRVARTLISNRILPLDERNYSFKQENGGWFISVLLKKGKGSTKNQRELIPIYRSDAEYYGEILNGTSFPAILYKQSDDFFLTVTIPVEKRYEEDRETVFIGIDLNQRKHVASLYNPKTRQFEWNYFFDLKPIDKKLKEIQRKISAIQRGRRKTALSSEEKKQIKELYSVIKKVIEKGHGDFIAKLLRIADSYWEAGYNVIFTLEDLKGITKRAEKSYAPFNRWLHSQWCYRKFGVMLETKRYKVEYRPAKGTSSDCHVCGARGKVYGKHKRLFKCECGLVDFNRGLNSARNLAVSAEDVEYT